jgi:hypothetical protein
MDYLLTAYWVALVVQLALLVWARRKRQGP